MARRLYLDPEASDAAVIEWGGKCYHRVGPSSQPPMVDAVGDEFESCAECEGSSSSSESSEGPAPCDDSELGTLQETYYVTYTLKVEWRGRDSPSDPWGPWNTMTDCTHTAEVNLQSPPPPPYVWEGDGLDANCGGGLEVYWTPCQWGFYVITASTAPSATKLTGDTPVGQYTPDDPIVIGDSELDDYQERYYVENVSASGSQ